MEEVKVKQITAVLVCYELGGKLVSLPDAPFEQMIDTTQEYFSKTVQLVPFSKAQPYLMSNLKFNYLKDDRTVFRKILPKPTHLVKLVKSSGSLLHQSIFSSAKIGTFVDEQNLSEVKSSASLLHQSTSCSAEIGTLDDEQNLSVIKSLASLLQQSTSSSAEIGTYEDECNISEVKSSASLLQQSTSSSAEIGTFDDECNISEVKSLASLLQQSTSSSSEIGTYDDEHDISEEFDEYDMNFLNPKKWKFSIHEDVDDDDRERSFLSKLPCTKRKLQTTVSSSRNSRTVIK